METESSFGGHPVSIDTDDRNSNIEEDDDAAKQDGPGGGPFTFRNESQNRANAQSRYARTSHHIKPIDLLCMTAAPDRHDRGSGHISACGVNQRQSRSHEDHR